MDHEIGSLRKTNTGVLLGDILRIAALYVGPQVSRCIHSLAVDLKRERLAVATDSCEIFELSTKDGRGLHDRPVVKGHAERRLSGLAPHPARPELCATVGDDKQVLVWNLDLKKLESHTQRPSPLSPSLHIFSLVSQRERERERELIAGCDIDLLGRDSCLVSFKKLSKSVWKRPALL